MSDAARQFYDSLMQYSDLQELINNGEAEGLYLECKAPGAPQLTRDIKSQLGRAVSGFSNTAGGVIIWGVSTTKHEHSGLDILSQIEPIGNCKLFARQVERAIPTLTTPSVTTAETKVMLQNKTDTRGVIITHIPKLIGDPTQSNIDNIFYFRSGDDFSVAPYEMVKRLFAATDVPDLHVLFDSKLVKLGTDGTWEVPIALRNDSSAIAEQIYVSVSVDNPSACDDIQLSGFIDASGINPGKKIFMLTITGVVHRGLNHVAGTLRVRMKIGKRPKRLLKLTTTLYANRMRARSVSVSIQLAKKGFSVVSSTENFLY